MAGIWDEIKAALGDYSQLVEKGSPLNNQFQQLKSNVEQHIPPQSAFRDPREMEQWSLGAALNAPMGLTFFNKKSPLWNVHDAKKADTMYKLGVDPNLVSRLTGTYKTHTGELVQEFSDTGLTMPSGGDKYSSVRFEGQPFKSAESGIENPEFLKHFPKKAQNMQVTLVNNALDRGGQYDHINDSLIAKGTDYGDTLDSAAHEFQHAAQHYQGRQAGGNPDMWLDPERLQNATDIEAYDVNRMLGKVQKLGEIADTAPPKLAEEALTRKNYLLQQLQAMKHDPNPVGSPRTRWSKYNRIYGEAEARTTAERRGMTDAQRRNNNPFTKATFGGVPIDMLLTYGPSGDLYSLETALKKGYIKK